MQEKRVPPRLTPERAKVFWAKVRKAEDWECWPFGSRDGYAAFSVNGRQYPVHRIAWQEGNDETLDPRHFVMHHCDNPPCCNPLHLTATVPSDNTRDWMAKNPRHGIPEWSEDAAPTWRTHYRGPAPSVALCGTQSAGLRTAAAFEEATCKTCCGIVERTVANLVALADALDCTTDWLLGRSER